MCPIAVRDTSVSGRGNRVHPPLLWLLASLAALVVAVGSLQADEPNAGQAAKKPTLGDLIDRAAESMKTRECSRLPPRSRNSTTRRSRDSYVR